MIANQAQISIIPGKDVKGTVPAMDLYNVSVYEALDAILQTNGMHWKKQGNFIYVYTQQDWDKLIKASHVRQTKVYTLYYVTAQDAAALIKPALSADAQIANHQGRPIPASPPSPPTPPPPTPPATPAATPWPASI